MAKFVAAPAEHWHVAMIRTTRDDDGSYSNVLRQVDTRYPSALAAATVIADLVEEFPFLTGKSIRELAELLASNPGMPTSPSMDGIGDHYTVLRCVRSGDEDCIESGNQWMSDLLGRRPD